MIRNDYRRAFIMLRAAMPGYGGHVRLERRTLTGSMYFIITAPQGVGELAAALVGRQDGAYFAAPVGPLARDRRGQLALAWQFDPRDIGGRPLEAYAWVAIVATGGPCALALTGNVEGSREVDARALEAAACALFAPAQGSVAGGAYDAEGEPAADLPGREDADDVNAVEVSGEAYQIEVSPGANPPAADADLSEAAPDVNLIESSTGANPPVLDADQTSPDASLSGSGASPSSPGAGETRGDVRVYTMTRARLRRMASRGDAGAPTHTATKPEIGAPDTPAQAAPNSPDGTEGVPTQATTEAREGIAETSPVTAAKRLGLDITVPWPGTAEPLRRLFATQAPVADAPRDGFTYVRVPMPTASGYPDSLAGLSVRDGQVVAVRHALPARRAPEPPAGLEACTWLPGEGEAGFWVAEDAVGE